MLYRAEGCQRCNGTGYRGRLGLYEVMLISEAIRSSRLSARVPMKSAEWLKLKA